MNITKKVCIYILVGLLTVTGTFTSFYKGAYAFEYVGGALAFEEAIKWLLASVGIISAGGMTADYWENHSQEFEDYCAQQNITDTEVANWQLKLCEGVLDKGSACWQAFKEWASTLTGSSSGGGVVAGSPVLVNGGSFTWGNNTVHTIKDFYTFYDTYTVNGQTFTGFFTTSQSYYENTNNIGHFIIASSTPLNENISNIGELSFTYDNKTVYYIMPYRNYIFPVTPVINDIANYYNTNSIFYDNASTANTDFCAWLSVYGSGGSAGSSFSDVTNYLYNKYNIINFTDASNYNDFLNYDIKAFYFYHSRYSSNNIYSVYLFYDDIPTIDSNNYISNCNYLNFYTGGTNIINGSSNIQVGNGNIENVISSNIINNGNKVFTIDNYNFDASSVDSDFISVQQDVTDLDVISSPIPDTDAQEVAIPMPGVADSDNEASSSAYDDIIDAVNNGQIELDDAITQIQDILKIIVYEEETEKIFPKPDNEEDQEDLDDKINQNKDNMGFTLGGLENVFPFCIPWDIYAFMSLLRAEPVPPKVELPFPNPLHPDDPWIVEVDFADWDDGMKIVRLAEDFLFIIGLAVLTRSLIGAGGGDG